MTIVYRSQIQQQTVSNLISVGVLKQDETDTYYQLLSAMSWEDVLAALLESNQLREYCTKPIDYYPIGEISKN